MKLILVASMALAAYFVSSADFTSMMITFSRLRVNGSYSARMQFHDARIVGAHDDAVRTHEVVDGRAFLEEFRVRHDIELQFGLALRQ